jgi:predicted nucleotidyltransferase
LGILLLEEEMVERAIVRSTPALTVRLPTPEDFIIMKALAHRPKDLEDIRTVVERNPGLDVARIEQWVKAFGEILEMPNLWRDIEKMLSNPSL